LGAGSQFLGSRSQASSLPSVATAKTTALAETIDGLYKAEVIRRRGFGRFFKEVEYTTLKWVDWFNNRRIVEPIGNMPLAEAE
jgi:transposase InsO family protein